MKVEGGRLHKSAEAVAPKCQKFLSSIKRKQKIDLDAIGSQANNNLVDLLRCQCRAEKICKDIEKSHSKCHSSVMGTGSYAGRKTCGDELETLFNCAMKEWFQIGRDYRLYISSWNTHKSFFRAKYLGFQNLVRIITEKYYRQYELHIQYSCCNYSSIFDSRNTFQIVRGRYIIFTCARTSKNNEDCCTG